MTLWTVAHQSPLSMGFSRQEYWSGLPSPPPGGLPDPGTEPGSPVLQADSLPSEPRHFVNNVKQSCNFQGLFGSIVKEIACHAGDPGSIPGSGRSPGKGHGKPLQYSCWKNPMERTLKKKKEFTTFQEICTYVQGKFHNAMNAGSDACK